MVYVSKVPGVGIGLVTRFAGEERGSIAIMFGLMLGVCVIFIGASVDIGRWMLARKQTQEAVDAANIAGLRTYQDTSNVGSAIAAAQANYNYSVTQSKRGTPSSNKLLLSDNITFIMSNAFTTMSATGDAYIKMPFLGLAPQILNLNKLPLLKTNGAENGVAQMAVGANSGTSLEVAIMIDNTGSMTESDNAGSTKLQDVIQGANALVDQVVWADQSTYTSKVAIIPFAEGVRLPSVGITDLARGKLTPGQSAIPGSQVYKVGGSTYSSDPMCVTERLGAQAYTDASPISYSVGTLYFHGNSVCAQLQDIVPLTTDTATLHSTINKMKAGGSTAGHIGTAWAWYALSPNFNSLWPSSTNAARPYSDLTTLDSSGQPILKKIAILMTDGDYNTEYCNGVSDQVINCTANNGVSNNQASQLCTNMKAKGIEVYTIGAQVSASAKAFLTSCATDPSHYYDATDGAALLTAFNDITKKLVKPYISH